MEAQSEGCLSTLCVLLGLGEICRQVFFIIYDAAEQQDGRLYDLGTDNYCWFYIGQAI
ncbi:MAG: hypothetical protein K0R50_4085 [Eubacterium sp.]|jgi:hypothetical protein|nr:hypothetical protein [Eubacterium sp.]